MTQPPSDSPTSVVRFLPARSAASTASASSGCAARYVLDLGDGVLAGVELGLTPSAAPAVLGASSAPVQIGGCPTASRFGSSKRAHAVVTRTTPVGSMTTVSKSPA